MILVTKTMTGPVGDHDRLDHLLRHDARRSVEVPLDDQLGWPTGPPRPRRGNLVAVAAVAVAAVAVSAVVISTLGDRGASEPPPTSAPTTAQAPSTGLFAYDFDGDGGNCFRIGEIGGAVATGCATGDELRSGRPLVATTSPTSWTLVSPAPAGRTADLASCVDDVTAPVLIDPVVCGPRPLVGVLPTSTWGSIEWSLRDAAGEAVALDALEGGGVGALFFGVPRSSCRVIATWRDGGDWSEACLAKFGSALTVVDGRAMAVTGTGVEELDERAAERLGCADVVDLLQLAAARGGVTTELRCAGDGAEVVQGSAELETGRTDPLTIRAQHTATGWTLLD